MTMLRGAGPLPLHVSGTHVLDSGDNYVALHGLNICSLEWDARGDHIEQSVKVALDDWHANIIRLPLNQDRWFGKTADSPDGGKAYRALVHRLVAAIKQRGDYAILDLHWSDCGEWGQNIGQHQLPDENSVAFWKSCAADYANEPAVIFDLYNEPIDADWKVWRDGGRVTENFQGKSLTYQATGLQTLLDAVRSTGARNLVHCGGPGYASRLDYPSSALLSDPHGNGVVYVSHFYPGWENVQSWEARIEAAQKRLPVFLEEFGDDNPSAPMDTPARRIGQIFAVIRKDHLNWTAWCMHPTARPCVIRDWTYAPTPEFGALVKLALEGKPVPIAPRKTTGVTQVAYEGKLEDPFQNWSSATVDLNAADPDNSGQHVMGVSIEPGKQLIIGTVPFDGLGFRGVQFEIRPSAGTSPALTLAASIMDKPHPAVPLPALTDGWNKVFVSFDQLGISGMEDVKSFTIRNGDDSKPSSFLIRRMEVVAK